MAHTAQGIAHGMGVFTEDKGLLRIIFQILHDLIGLGVHPALHIADLIEIPVPERPFVMDQAGRILLFKVPAHSQDILPGIRFIAAGPDQDGGMVLIPLQHGLSPVQHTGLPFRQAPRHVPGRLAGPHLLPGAVAL